MKSFTLIPCGESSEGYEYIDEFNFGEDLYQLGKNDKGEILIINEWENFGPFMSIEMAYKGMALHFYQENQKKSKLIFAIEELIRTQT